MEVDIRAENVSIRKKWCFNAVTCLTCVTLRHNGYRAKKEKEEEGNRCYNYCSIIFFLIFLVDLLFINRKSLANTIRKISIAKPYGSLHVNGNCLEKKTLNPTLSLNIFNNAMGNCILWLQSLANLYDSIQINFINKQIVFKHDFNQSTASDYVNLYKLAQRFSIQRPLIIYEYLILAIQSLLQLNSQSRSMIIMCL